MRGHVTYLLRPLRQGCAVSFFSQASRRRLIPGIFVLMKSSQENLRPTMESQRELQKMRCLRLAQNMVCTSLIWGWRRFMVAGGRENLERIARAIQSGWFLPMPETGNWRSLVHIQDVVEVIRVVAKGQKLASVPTSLLIKMLTPEGKFMSISELRLAYRQCQL